MNVLLAAAAFSSEVSGVQRHAFNAARALLLRHEIKTVHLVVASWQRKLAEDFLHNADRRLVIHAAEMGGSSIGRNAWYYWRLPELAHELDVDLAHLAYPVPVNARAFRCPVVVTLHDMYPYEIPMNFGFPKYVANRTILRQCLNAADGIACVSETTRARMRKYLPERLNEKAVCIPNGVSQMPAAVRPAFFDWSNDPFLLCVAQHRRNKNIPLLLRSFARLAREGKIDARMRLLVIGINGPETERIHQTVAAHKLEGRTSFVSGLSDAELHWCYANCSVLVAPSSTEGFGLPVAEGLLAGCRIVCSEIGAHREIGAERCRFVNLREDAEHALAEAIANALDEISSQPRPNPVSLPQLSAEAVGEQYIRLYRKLLKTRAVGNRHSSAIAMRSARSADREQTLKADFAHPHADVLRVQVSAVNLEKATELACRWIDRGGSGYACMTGVHGVMEAQRDEPLRGILNRAVLNAADGTPLSWVGRLQGFREMNYVTGPQFMERMCEIAAERGYRIFFYGGNPGVAELLSDRLQARFPGLRVAGTWTPPFRPLNAKEEEEMLTAVRRARPHLMWVGLSTPRQERFMAQYVERLEVPLLVGVGAAFDYHTGRLRDCPRWVKRAGLQWLHRLVQEPRRLAPRYLRNNPAFLWRILLQLAGMRSDAANLQRADDTQRKYEAGT